MQENAGTTDLKPIITTNFKTKQPKKCKECKGLITDGETSGTNLMTQSIPSRVCQTCQKEKRKAHAKMRLVKSVKLQKSKPPKEKRKKCLECLIRPRAKRRKSKGFYTKCKTCLLKYDVGYWGDKCWEWFAKWFKAVMVTFEGYFTCYTCGKTFTIDLAQAGHCFHRGRQAFKALDFDTAHIHLQCGGCNMDSQGNKQNVFQANLTREIGLEAVELMIWRRNNEPALTIPELQEKIEFYKADLKKVSHY